MGQMGCILVYNENDLVKLSQIRAIQHLEKYYFS
jgi:hypothetical protein